MTAKEVLREEFRLKHFSLDFPYKEPFYTSQWNFPHWIFILIRVVFSLYTIGSLIHYFVVTEGPPHVLIRLELWAYLVLTIHFLLALVATIWLTVQSRKVGTNDNEMNSSKSGENQEDVKEGENNETSPKMGPLPWYLKLSWLLTSIITIWSVTVTVIYYIVLFPQTGAEFINLQTMNSICIYIDTYVSARPVRILHMIYPIIFGVVYTICTVIFWAVDKDRNILYSVLDWNHPGIAIGVVLFVLLIVLPVFHLCFYGVYRMRLWSFKRFYKHDYFTEK